MQELSLKTKPRPRAVTFLLTTLKLGVSLLCAVLAWEMILRFFVVSYPGAHTHPTIGRIINKGEFVNGTEGFSRTHFNSLGMRNDEIGPKQQGEYRILVLGDSYTEAVQVPDKETFTQQFEKDLSQKTNKRVNVINAGRSGASPAYYLYLADYYKEFEPDFVIIQINNSDFTVDLLDEGKVFYLEKSNGYQVKFNKEFVSRNPITSKLQQFDFLTRISSLRVGVDNLLKMRSEQSEPKLDPTPNKHLISFVLSELRNKYENVVLLYLPEMENENNGKVDSAESTIESESRLINLPLLNMRNDFTNFINSTLQPVKGFNNTTPGAGHLNKHGHRIVAENLSDYMESRVGE